MNGTFVFCVFFVAIVTAGSCEHGACKAGDDEELALLQMQRSGSALGARGEPAHVLCNYSDTMCQGNQCCPRAPQTGDRTYPCPSASAEFAGCEFNRSLPAPSPAPALELRTREVTIGNGLRFQCFETATCQNKDENAENVLMIHGFPERKEFWAELMRELAAVDGKKYCAAACDMHGYSPGASPDDKSMYQSDKIRADTFEIATQFGFQQFHLVTHDHGAVLGWRMAGSQDAARIKTFSSLAIPHLDAASDALYGESASEWQQVASQYFTMFVLDDSASLYNNFWYGIFRCSWGSCFATPADLQKAMWWYNGIFSDDGQHAKLAMPPSMSVEEINATTFPGKQQVMGLRGPFSNYTGSGFPQAGRLGNIDIPTLFICGNQDYALLCTMDWSKATRDYVDAAYTYKEVDCGHNLTACEDSAVTQEVFMSIIEHLNGAGSESD